MPTKGSLLQPIVHANCRLSSTVMSDQSQVRNDKLMAETLRGNNSKYTKIQDILNKKQRGEGGNDEDSYRDYDLSLCTQTIVGGGPAIT